MLMSYVKIYQSVWTLKDYAKAFSGLCYCF